MEKQFSCKTAAEYYAFSQDYFRQLVFNEKIKYNKICRQVRFNKSDLDKYFEDRTTIVEAK